ncbi:hypothetical protein HpMS107_49780 [Helicobacter pylori]
MKRYKYLALFLAVSLLVGAIYLWWTGVPEGYGEYVAVRCLEDTPSGQSCIQKEITTEERIALTKGKKQHDDGTFEVSVTQKRLDVINSALKAANESRTGSRRNLLKSVRQEALRCAGGAFELLAVIPEFPGRWSAVFRTKEGRRMLFVRYDFFAAGGSMGRFEYLLRSKVNGNSAILMLMNGVRGDSRMWEALWEANGVTFDLDVEDAGKKDAAGDPYTSAQVLDMASTFDRNCHWSRDKIEHP